MTEISATLAQVNLAATGLERLALRESQLPLVPDTLTTDSILNTNVLIKVMGFRLMDPNAPRFTQPKAAAYAAHVSRVGLSQNLKETLWEYFSTISEDVLRLMFGSDFVLFLKSDVVYLVTSPDAFESDKERVLKAYREWEPRFHIRTPLPDGN